MGILYSQKQGLLTIFVLAWAATSFVFIWTGVDNADPNIAYSGAAALLCIIGIACFVTWRQRFSRVTGRIVLSMIFIVALATVAWGAFEVSHEWPVTTNEAGFRQAAERAGLDTLGWVHYVGRKNGYDYFKIHKNVGQRTYRIPEGTSLVTIFQPFSSNPQDWSIWPNAQYWQSWRRLNMGGEPASKDKGQPSVN